MSYLALSLSLQLTQGLTPRAIEHGFRFFAKHLSPVLSEWLSHQATTMLLKELTAVGLAPRSGVERPTLQSVEQLTQRLGQHNVTLAWSSSPEYPHPVKARLREQAPRWLWRAGTTGEGLLPHITVVGSRQLSAHYAAAATALGQALAESGFTVASGLARGADTAAHLGAQHTRAGTLAIPAQGILNTLEERAYAGHWSFYGLGKPWARFNTGLALARNRVLAACGSGVVLVASDLRGGALYTVKAARALGLPVWCFYTPGADCPRANRFLVEQQLATPLAFDTQDPLSWAQTIRETLTNNAADRRATPTIEQPGLFTECA